MLLTGLSSAPGRNRSSDPAPSVAEAARRAREKKKENAKPVRTLTNDDSAGGPCGGRGHRTATPAPAAKGEDAVAPAANEDGEKKSPAAGDRPKKLSCAKSKCSRPGTSEKATGSASQRIGHNGAQSCAGYDSYYSKTDYANDKEGKANLGRPKHNRISDKKQTADELKSARR